MKKHIYETLIIIVGNFILALGICAFITPVVDYRWCFRYRDCCQIIDRNKYFLYCVCNKYCNVCLLVYFYFGKKFAAGTLLSTFLYPTFLAILERVPALSTILVMLYYQLYMPDYVLA